MKATLHLGPEEIKTALAEYVKKYAGQDMTNHSAVIKEKHHGDQRDSWTTSYLEGFNVEVNL